MVINGKTGCLVSGRIVSEPEFKGLASGKSLYTFRICAVDGDENKGIAAVFFTVNVWGNQAIVMNKLLAKGDVVCAMGRYNQREYEGKTYYEVNTYGEVFPNICWADQKIEAVDGGTHKAEPIVAAPALEDFSTIGDDAGDLPF